MAEKNPQKRTFPGIVVSEYLALSQITISAWRTSRAWCCPCQTSGDSFAFLLIFGLILRFFRTSCSIFYPRALRTKSGFCSLYVPCVSLPRATQDNGRERNLVAVLVFTSIFLTAKEKTQWDTLLSCKFNVDTTCVELRYSAGEILSINCIAV